MDHYKLIREDMAARQISARGIDNQKVLNAMKSVPREKFVPPEELSRSYYDGPLPIGYNQTISQPYVVAYMTELLALSDSCKVLEMGTGSGYQTAVLAQTAEWVYTIEVIKALGLKAEKLLTDELGYKNISFKFANGREGWPEFAPFDRILLTAAPITFPVNLFDQLAEGGIAVAPVGDYYQQIIKYTKIHGKIQSEKLIGVAFVPFV